jgi:hypothetical protein
MVVSGISVFLFRPTANVHQTGAECKVQSGFQRLVPPRTVEEVIFTSTWLAQSIALRSFAV